MYALSIMGLKYISIHTTRKVVTEETFFIVSALLNFNPHHPQGGDRNRDTLMDVIGISIHTTRKVVTMSTGKRLRL